MKIIRIYFEKQVTKLFLERAKNYNYNYIIASLKQ